VYVKGERRDGLRRGMDGGLEERRLALLLKGTPKHLCEFFGSLIEVEY